MYTLLSKYKYEREVNVDRNNYCTTSNYNQIIDAMKARDEDTSK